MLTYKTVRSVARECYPVPNWVFVDADAGDGPVYATEILPADPAAISSAVCFGMPKQTAELMAAGSAGNISVAYTGPSPASASTNTQLGTG